MTNPVSWQSGMIAVLRRSAALLRSATPLLCAALILLCTATPIAVWAQPPVQPSRRTVSPSSPIVKNVSFHSAALNRDMRYRLYLPHHYPATTRRYPVLYLLHGLFGNYQNWDTLTHLASHVSGMDWIIVMPDAGDSWYTNSASVPKDKFEDYVARDLVAEVDGRYRTIRDRQARAIAGLSMGGYGAVKFALRYPHSFAFAASLSGAMDAARDLDSRLPEFAPKLVEVFGAPGNPTRAHNDIFQLLPKSAPDELPYLYLACGSEDRFLLVNRDFVSELAQRHIRYEYRENPGTHDWAYWDREIAPLLSAMQNQISQKPH